MSLDTFWSAIEAQLEELATAKTADDVLAILSKERCPEDILFSGEGFFAGSGGDGTVRDALYRAGWRTVWAEASYYWVMRAPNGDEITYIEGDVLRGNRVPEAS